MKIVPGMLAFCLLAYAGSLTLGIQQSGEELDRTVLPIQGPIPPTTSVLDVRNATPPPRFEVTAPAGAPNVLLVLVDDLGFAGTSAFGGPVPTPNFDRVAAQGLHYNNFHTTAVCSPTRAALKSGRNHHVSTGTLYISDKQVATGRIGRTQPMIFSADETADIGIDLATPVVEAIGSERRSRFTGSIPKITIEVK